LKQVHLTVRECTDWKNKKCYSTHVSFDLVANLCAVNLTWLCFQTDIEGICEKVMYIHN
jgi:hypothetical protein